MDNTVKVVEIDQVREKLIELLYDTMFFEGYGRELCEQQADHLIAHLLLDNQVASSKWIPVTERLPEESGKYLAYCGEYDGICVLYYEVLKTKGKWRTKWKEVTHWMPLPAPPKGE